MNRDITYPTVSKESFNLSFETDSNRSYSKDRFPLVSFLFTFCHECIFLVEFMNFEKDHHSEFSLDDIELIGDI